MKQLICIIALCLVTTCATATPEKENDRFKCTFYKSSELIGKVVVVVIEDTESGVEYLFVQRGYGAGLCPLVQGKKTVKGDADIYEAFWGGK